MTTTKVIVGKKGNQFYAAIVGFPVNKFHKTLSGALRYADRLARQNGGVVTINKGCE